jgi:hypothetical protein
MNERIQKLIEQATSTQGPTPYNPLTFEVFDKEKFAELIVRDCVYMVMGYECALNRDNQLSSAMLEHFGVEE